MILVALAAVGIALPVRAQEPASITTPNKVESSIGTLQYNDGAPGDALDTRTQTNDQDVKGEKR